MTSPADSKGGGGGIGMNMVTTVMAFSVSAFFVLFVFVRLLCARLQLRTESHAAANTGDAFVVHAYNVERGIRVLEPSVVTSFPTVKLGDGTQRPTGKEESQCTVCLEEYAAKDLVRVLPACGHAFHAACIDAWLRQQPTCPVCRASLRATKNHPHHRGTTLDRGLDAATAPASRSQQVPASTPSYSGGVTASSPPQVAADQTGTGLPGRLEIVIEEPGSSAGDQQQGAGVVDRSVGASLDSADMHAACTVSVQIARD